MAANLYEVDNDGRLDKEAASYNDPMVLDLLTNATDYFALEVYFENSIRFIRSYVHAIVIGSISNSYSSTSAFDAVLITETCGLPLPPTYIPPLILSYVIEYGPKL